MKNKTVAILESHMPDHIPSLVRKYGGTPFSAPALAEIPDVGPAYIEELIRDWNSAPPDVFIFQTGVGTRALFAATDSLGLTVFLLRILGAAQVIARGPKPATTLRSREVRIDRTAGSPFTTHEVLAEMQDTPLRGKRVVVQRYGETNRELRAALESQGAEVIEIVTYRWTLPEGTAPLLRLIDALGRDEIDLVAFTSASQASNLFAVAKDERKEASLRQSHRTVRSKGCLSNKTALAMVFKLAQAAEKHWRCLDGQSQLPKIIQRCEIRRWVRGHRKA